MRRTLKLFVIPAGTPAGSPPEPGPDVELEAASDNLDLIQKGISRSSGSASNTLVRSTIAGTVLEVRCRAGEAIEPNAVLFVLEAMKMKTSIVAPERGRIGQVLVAPGDAVVEGQPLLHYE